VGKLDNPQEQANSQLAVGRHALERGMVSLRELAELIARTNAEAFEIINQRATSCMKEIQDSAGSKSK
jgi:phasin family protein